MAQLHALLLTDVVDSTRLTEELGDARMAELWTAHDRVARDLLPLWRGREIDKTDGMLLLFGEVGDAVGYALAYHRALSAAKLPFKARAGIHVGPITLRPNPADDVARGAKPIEVDGLALPVTARVMSVALGTQTLLSADARLALGVAPQRVMSHGHWRMHGVADPVELFEVGEAGAPFTAPPDGTKVYRVMRQGDLWQPVREVRHSVPAERDSFVGRQEPLHLIGKKLEDGARLISVLGIGGTGKTRLVTRFAWTRLGDYPGGVWFCDLSQARTVDGIYFAVAQGLDVPLGKTDPVVQLAHAIAGRGECLVILDNFEQVARHAEETLGRWLERAPQARFIVTTRELLGIVGEQSLALAPLPAIDAVALFQRRAAALLQGYAPTAKDLAAIARLVEVLDGLPLAIELAAARVNVMSPHALLLRMHERFDLLRARGSRQDRQATLRAAFDWSWELLSDPEKAVLAQLSVFEGGFGLTAAEAVIDVSAFEQAPSPVDALGWLVDKSFVRRLSDDRFDLLESVRQYALEHLRTPGRYVSSGPQALEAAEQRHGGHFGRRGAKDEERVGYLDLDNMVVACRRAIARADADTASRTLVNAWSQINQRGPFRVGLELARAVAAIEGIAAEARARAELVLGLALRQCGPVADAWPHAIAARDGARALGDRVLMARAAHLLANLHAQVGKEADAAIGFEESLRASAEVDDASLRCSIYTSMGSYFEAVGRTEDARKHYEAALDLAREAGLRSWEGGSAGNLGQFHHNQGRLEQARELYQQAVLISRELGERQWEANGRSNLGLLHFNQGRMNEAHTELQAALAMARELGHVRLVCIAECNLGLVAEALGNPAAARAHHEVAIATAHELGDGRSEGQFLGYLGTLHARQSRFAEAQDCLNAGEALLRASADRSSLGILLCGRAEAEYRAANLPTSEAALAEAVSIATLLAIGVDSASEFATALRRTRQLLSVTA